MKILILLSFLVNLNAFATGLKQFVPTEKIQSNDINGNFNKLKTKTYIHGIFTPIEPAVDVKFHSFTVNKNELNTALKIDYFNVFRGLGDKSFGIQVLVNGQPCQQDLFFKFYYGANNHTPRLLSGICELSIPANGSVVIDFYTRASGHSSGYGNVFIGWENQYYKFEVEEILLDQSISVNP